MASALAVGVTLAAAGCGSDDDGGGTATDPATAAGTATAGATSPTGTTAGKPADIAFVTLSNLPFNQQEALGATNVVRRNGGSLKTFSANYDPSKQLQQCKDAVSSGRFNGILLSATDVASAGPCITTAKAAGIPVATIENAVGTDPDDNAPQVDGVVASVVTNPATKAAGVAEQVKTACEGIDPCQVIFEVASPTDPLTNGSLEAVKALGGNVEVVQTFAGQYDPSIITTKMPDILSAHPDADVYASTADSQVVAAIPAVKAAGMFGRLKLLGNGGSEQGIEALKAGDIESTLGSWPIQMGEVAATGLEQAINGQEVTAPATDAYKIDEPFQITKANVDQFTPEW